MPMENSLTLYEVLSMLSVQFPLIIAAITLIYNAAQAQKQYKSGFFVRLSVCLDGVLC